MKKKKVLLFIYIILLFNYSFSQNLIESTKLHSIENQFDYTAEYVLKYKIKSISEYKTEYGIKFLNSKHQFNKFGNPVFKKNTDRYGDSIITNYTYNDLNNILSKTIYKRIDKQPYKYMTTDIFDWVYDENGILLEKYEYSMIDFIPSDNGGWSFSPKMMATKCFTYTYDFTNLTVKIENKCKNSKYQVYPPFYSAQVETNLKFFENGKISESEQFYKKGDDERMFIKKFDSLGNEILKKENSIIIETNWIFPKSYNPIEKSRIIETDTIRNIEKSIIEIRYTLKSQVKGIEILNLIYDASESLDLVELYWYSDNSEDLLYSSIISKYLEGKVSSVEYYLSNLAPINFSGYHDSRGYNPPKEIYSKTFYEYFENDLLKNITSYDRDGVEIGNTYYEIEYDE